MSRRKGIDFTATYVEWDIMLQVLNKLEKEQKPYQALLIGLGIYTGMRIGDILKLTWKDILYKKDLCIEEEKTGKKRNIPIHDNLYNLIIRCYKQIDPWTESELLFRQQASYNRSKIVAASTLNRWIKKAVEPFGVNGGNISTHTLRKTFGRRIWENNGKTAEALIMLMELFNHSSIDITKRYLGIRQEELNKLYLKL